MTPACYHGRERSSACQPQLARGSGEREVGAPSTTRTCDLPVRSGKKGSSGGSGTPLPHYFRASSSTGDHSRTPRAASDCLPFGSRSASPVSRWNGKAGRGMPRRQGQHGCGQQRQCRRPALLPMPLPSLWGRQAARCRVARVPQSPPVHYRLRRWSHQAPARRLLALDLRPACAAPVAPLS